METMETTAPATIPAETTIPIESQETTPAETVPVTAEEDLPSVETTIPIFYFPDVLPMVVPETTEYTEPAETVEVITYEQVQAVASDIIHTNLFGSFLICGTLAGIALCWRLLH